MDFINDFMASGLGCRLTMGLLLLALALNLLSLALRLLDVLLHDESDRADGSSHRERKDEMEND
ncbi:hypothetical protein [Bifidobacterium moukalabense]|uniref:hypothetical protein n=1 Tax=Bifidobacterium moukalabense TaxID=1333651 RepID=UPI0010F61E33|nr:hypothetical protein [Bifidobacterium moukalabense]